MRGEEEREKDLYDTYNDGNMSYTSKKFSKKASV